MIFLFLTFYGQNFEWTLPYNLNRFKFPRVHNPAHEMILPHIFSVPKCEICHEFLPKLAIKLVYRPPLSLFPNISDGATYQGLNFPFFPNFITPFMSVICKNTLSLTTNFKFLYLTLA